MQRSFIFPALNLGLAAALALAGSMASLQGQAVSNSVLRDITLGGWQQTVKWTNVSSSNQYSWESFTDYIGKEPDNPSSYYYGLTRDDTDPDAVNWTGSAAYTSRIQAIGASSATAGFYSYQGDFGVKAAAGTSGFSIQSVTFQVALMRHPEYSLQEHLFHRHTDYWQEGDRYGGDSSDNPDGVYNYNPALAAMDTMISGYAGGPLLSYTTLEGNSGVLAPVGADILGSPVWVSVGGFSGNYYDLAYQWDLSSVAGTVVGVEVLMPVIHSSSTIGVQLDLGNTFTQVLTAVPEPAAWAAVFGAGSLVFAFARRRLRSPGRRSSSRTALLS